MPVVQGKGVWSFAYLPLKFPELLDPGSQHSPHIQFMGLTLNYSLSWNIKFLKNGVFAAILVKKNVLVTRDCSHHGWWAGVPWESSGRKECLPSSSDQTAPTPYSEPWGSSGCENTGSWPQIAEIHTKGMISVSPDSCIFPHIEKC